MKLTVLGGSAAGPNTGQGCSGYYVESATSRIVLDLGPGTLPELRRHTDFRTLDGIVISHLHLDHTLDIGALRFALAYNPIKAPARVPLWLPPGGLEFLERFASAFAEPGMAAEFFAAVFAPAEYDPDHPLHVGDTVVRFARTVHPIPCWAMRVANADGGRDLGYTADTGPAADLAPLFHDVGVLIAEATNLEPLPHDPADRIHLTAAEAGDLATRAGASTLVLTHLWEERGVATMRSAATTTFPGDLRVAQPGLRVEW